MAQLTRIPGFPGGSDTMVQSGKYNLKLLLSLVLDYFRWTQLTPMIITWSFALLMLTAMTIANLQAQSISAVQWVLQWLTHLPVLGQHVNEWMSQSGSEKHITGSDLKSFVMTAWSVISLAFMLLGMILSTLSKPTQPWSLKRKLAVVGSAAFVLLAGFISNYFTHIEKFSGETSGWMLNFSALSLIVFLVSLYSLAVSQFIQFLQGRLCNNNGVLV